MSRDLDPKCKQCRRSGEKLFLKGERCFTQKCAIVKRNYAPGLHGMKGKTSTSEYGIQLREKQKLKKTYRIGERQFALYFSRADKGEGVTSDNLLRLLESRLDNVVYRVGIGSSRDKARQLVNHGHFLVNEKPVHIASYILSEGDVVSVSDTSKKKKVFQGLENVIDVKNIPAWVEFDIKNLKAKIISPPDPKATGHKVNMRLVVEFYSK